MDRHCTDVIAAGLTAVLSDLWLCRGSGRLLLTDVEKSSVRSSDCHRVPDHRQCYQGTL